MAERPLGGPGQRAAGPGRVLLTTVLVVGMTASALPVFAMGALGPFVTSDLSLSRAAFGALTTIFFIAAAVLSHLGGRFVDALGGTRLVVWMLLLIATSLLVAAGAPGYLILVFAMVVGGMASALSNPATNEVVATHLRQGAQGLTLGLKQSGVWLGAVISGIALPPVAGQYGWRVAVAMLVIVPVVGLALARWRLAGGTRGADTLAEPSAARTVVSVPWLTAYTFFMGAGAQTATVYIALYAHESLAMTETHAGWALSMVGITGVAARIWLGPYSERSGRITRLLVVLALVAFVSQAFILWAEAAGDWLLWVGAAGTGTSAIAFNAVVMMAIVRGTARGQTGRASGIVQGGFFLGLLSSPFIFGLIVDATGSYANGWYLALAMYGAALATAWTWHRRSPVALAY